MSLAKTIECGKTLRAVGFDDTHHLDLALGEPVNFAGIVCAGTRFEGMLWGDLEKHGLDSTDSIIEIFRTSKFWDQVHIVLLDGITFGGCNIVDLPKLHRVLRVPIAAVMRKLPDMEKFNFFMSQLPDPEERRRRTQAAGIIHQIDNWIFQCIGDEPEVIAKALTQLTDTGKMPEALRLAHLVGAAVTFGVSSKRA